MKKIYLLIVALSLIALVLSIIILIQKTTESKEINDFCSAIGSNSKCSTVQQSKYGKIFGIDNPWFGIIGFSVLGVLAGMNYFRKNNIRKILIIAGSIFAGLVALWFLYLQTFVLKAYCIFCVIVDILSLVILFTTIYMIFKEHNKKLKK